eukprot:TRINITY_DN6988_c2_g1_i2.p3 TRINITY_DN6988_c2_g1~~TRINITY_DN6988_c2_g1_i2.p3  ORF type:complete len:175 (-),score=18.94 TRINITY_DN6988_c2_g1_i2:162-665(-)
MTINSDDFATEHHKQPLNVSWLQKIADFMDPSYLFYDEPFSLGDWDKHQRWRRHCPKGLVCVRAAWGMNGPLLYLTLLTVAVGVYHEILPEQGWPHLSEDVPVTLIITANLGKLSCKLEVIWGYISGIQLYVKLFEQVFRGFIGVVIFFSGFCQILSRLFCGILLDV